MAKWSWKLARVAGIDIRMHWTFLLLLAYVAWMHLGAGEVFGGAVAGIIFVLALFVCVILHELGHAMAARRYGIATKDITLLPIGGVAQLERMPREPKQELMVALAGPAVNVVIAAALFLVLFALGMLGRLLAVPSASMTLGGFLGNLMIVNMMLVVFNMLPAFPMDGGRVLRALLASRMDFVSATRTAASVGQLMAIGFGILGLMMGQPFLLFIALFVYLGAEAEARGAEFESAVAGITVGEAMMTRFRTLRPDDTLQHAADELLAGAQTDFPVVDETGVVGLLERQSLVDALGNGRHTGLVGEAMTESPDSVDESSPLDATMKRMNEESRRSLPVLRRGELVGLLTLENIGELLMLRSSGSRRKPDGQDSELKQTVLNR